jgi:hypothetical protein
LPEEQYNKMEYTINTQKEEIRELTQRISILTEDLEKITNLFTDTKHDLDCKNVLLKQTEDNLKCSKIMCEELKEECSVQEYMLSEKTKVEDALYGQAEKLAKEKNVVEKELKMVFDKLDTVNEIALTNIDKVKIFTNDMESNYQLFSSAGAQMNTEIHENLDAICVNLNKTKHEVWGAKEKNKNSLRSFEKTLLDWLKEQNDFAYNEYLLKVTKFKEDFLQENVCHSNERDLKLKEFLESITEQFSKLKDEGLEKMVHFINELNDKKELFISNNIGFQMKEKFLKENIEKIKFNSSCSDKKLSTLEDKTNSIDRELGEIKELGEACTQNLSKIFELVSETLKKKQALDEKIANVEQKNAQNSKEIVNFKETNKKMEQLSIEKLNDDFKSLVELPILDYLNSNTQIIDKVYLFFGIFKLRNKNVSVFKMINR